MQNKTTLKQTYGPLALSQSPCCHDLMKHWEKQKPLKGYCAIINCHLTLATLVLLDTLISTGLTVTVTCAPELVNHDNIRLEITAQNINYIPYETLNTEAHQFDLVFDCGAGLVKKVKSRCGFIELTHVAKDYYKDIDSQAISIDTGVIKLIETTFGTGDGLVRGLSYVTEQKGISLSSLSYIIFGYGKVGRGIAYCLNHAGVSADKITVVEAKESLLPLIEKHGYNAFHLIKNPQALKELVSNIDCAITATGIPGAISPHLTESDFPKKTYLINMGTFDEWGKNFPLRRILNNKKPLNFILEFPTKISYIDPIFALLAQTGVVQILNKAPRESGFKNISREIEDPILDFWVKSNHSQEEYTFIQELQQAS